MSDDYSIWLLLIGPVGAAGFYWAMYRYYRNVDKSHAFEHETSIHAQPVMTKDYHVDSLIGTRKKYVEGNNVSDYRERVQRERR